MIEKIKYWMWWRGVEPRDLIYASFCLGCLLALSVFGLCVIFS